MTRHEARSFSESLISGAVEPIAFQNRGDRNVDPRSLEARADKVVVIAVLAFVVGFLSLFAFAAARHEPEGSLRDARLMSMYGP